MMKHLLFISILCSLALAACAGSGAPKLIGAASREATPGPRLLSPAGEEVVYHAVMEMEVSDAEKSAGRAEGLASRYGGYLVSSQLWYEDGKKHASVSLAVPAGNYESLYRAVRDLGKLYGETVTGQLVAQQPGGREINAHITVNFHPGGTVWPSLPVTGWNPGRTVGNAFTVFLTIFGFIADIFLWALIVVGPFALMAWGAWALFRKIR
ncbi:MAG: DUF4349 domain-containing protein [Chloroflexota bacterium]